MNDMTVWEFPVLLALSVLGGMKSVCALDIWRGREFHLPACLTQKNVCLYSAVWMVIYGVSWFATGRSPSALRVTDLLGCYLMLGAVDGKRRIVPDFMLGMEFIGQMLLGAFLAAPETLLSILISGAVFAGIALGFAWLSRGKIGMGDARLLGVTAMTAGWLFALQILFFGMMFSFLYSIWLILFRKKGLDSEFPFVPFLTAGTVVSVLLSV